MRPGSCSWGPHLWKETEKSASNGVLSPCWAVPRGPGAAGKGLTLTGMSGWVTGDAPCRVLGALSIGVRAEIWKEVPPTGPRAGPLQGLRTEVTAK